MYENEAAKSQVRIAYEVKNNNKNALDYLILTFNAFSFYV